MSLITNGVSSLSVSYTRRSWSKWVTVLNNFPGSVPGLRTKEGSSVGTCPYEIGSVIRTLIWGCQTKNRKEVGAGRVVNRESHLSSLSSDSETFTTTTPTPTAPRLLLSLLQRDFPRESGRQISKALFRDNFVNVETTKEVTFNKWADRGECRTFEKISFFMPYTTLGPNWLCN